MWQWQQQQQQQQWHNNTWPRSPCEFLTHVLFLEGHDNSRIPTPLVRYVNIMRHVITDIGMMCFRVVAKVAPVVIKNPAIDNAARKEVCERVRWCWCVCACVYLSSGRDDATHSLILMSGPRSDKQNIRQIDKERKRREKGERRERGEAEVIIHYLQRCQTSQNLRLKVLLTAPISALSLSHFARHHANSSQ